MAAQTLRDAATFLAISVMLGLSLAASPAELHQQHSRSSLIRHEINTVVPEQMALDVAESTALAEINSVVADGAHTTFDDKVLDEEIYTTKLAQLNELQAVSSRLFLISLLVGLLLALLAYGLWYVVDIAAGLESLDISPSRSSAREEPPEGETTKEGDMADTTDEKKEGDGADANEKKEGDGADASEKKEGDGADANEKKEGDGADATETKDGDGADANEKKDDGADANEKKEGDGADASEKKEGAGVDANETKEEEGS
jgi:hypothetical protein